MKFYRILRDFITHARIHEYMYARSTFKIRHFIENPISLSSGL